MITLPAKITSTCFTSRGSICNFGRKRYCNCFLVWYWVTEIPIWWLYNSGNLKKNIDRSIRSKKGNRNSAYNGGLRNQNQKLEFPTKAPPRHEEVIAREGRMHANPDGVVPPPAPPSMMVLFPPSPFMPHPPSSPPSMEHVHAPRGTQGRVGVVSCSWQRRCVKILCLLPL